ncbi:ABC transporter ATP-binding protein [Rickettsiales endosymbiont of Stachyamoeba lipophora]|uniref:ABC transporter ATP-binding protein n=1 Tax=Rickettsiales endosymbiont of Stachyamoeba lipophora TaxID=2486578 RepID=UPI000F645A67|nr:ABC transporter ATP-binding protein [Rickettsiales endosymbiont of Stachyamoeba lipophora]AZL15840.1 ABC transporter ATP-binding protein [Rickettsiales endosymbiont of Stachyamoeba lipophora]
MNKKNIILEINNASKTSNNVTILHDINLKIYQGEFFALLGPSGCGKTTLLRMIGGFDSPSSGQIKIDGLDMQQIPPFERHVNMMFQSYALFPHMNVYDNIAFGLRQQKITENSIAEKVEEVLSILKIDQFKNRAINELSGGQQQRVALARSIIKRPKILLLDEPMGALDIKTREHTQIELINLQHMLGITFVMVTHNQQEAMAMANRIAIMNHGKILQIDSPRHIYDYPNDKFVADFIGSINFLAGQIVDYNKENDIATVQLNNNQELIIVKKPEHTRIGDQIDLALRPEELYLSTEKPINGDNFVAATINEISFAGSELIFYLSLHDTQTIMVTISTAAGSYNPDFIIGAQLYILWDQEDGVILVK